MHALWLGDFPSRGARDARPFMAWIRWARGAMGQVATLGLNRPVLIGATVGLGVAALIVLTVRVGPFALAVTLFSPVSSTLILVSLTAGVAMMSGASRVLARSRRRIVDLGRCPTCLYPLRDIESEADEITTCPECGGGWDMRPLGPTEVVVVGRKVPSEDAVDFSKVAEGSRPHYQRREIKRPATIVASTGLPPNS